MFRVVFHDWDDDATVRILRAVLQAVGKRAVTLLIVEVCSPCHPRQPPWLSTSPTAGHCCGASEYRQQWCATQVHDQNKWVCCQCSTSSCLRLPCNRASPHECLLECCQLGSKKTTPGPAATLTTTRSNLCGAQTVIANEFCDGVYQRGLQDLNMLVAQHSRERTAAQWAATLAAGGFRLTRVVATRSAFSVVVAQPAKA